MCVLAMEFNGRFTRGYEKLMIAMEVVVALEIYSLL
jgi:hypothetical protein